MFNTTRVYNTTNHPRTLEVKEHRAPTDESVKILKEMEKEAMDKIVEMGKIEDNIFNVKWYIYGDQYSWEDWCRCVFTLNEKKYDFKFILPCKFTNTSEIIPKIKEELLKELSSVLLKDLFKNCGNIIVKKYQSKHNEIY